MGNSRSKIEAKLRKIEAVPGPNIEKFIYEKLEGGIWKISFRYEYCIPLSMIHDILRLLLISYPNVGSNLSLVRGEKPIVKLVSLREQVYQAYLLLKQVDPNVTKESLVCREENGRKLLCCRRVHFLNDDSDYQDQYLDVEIIRQDSDFKISSHTIFSDLEETDADCSDEENEEIQTRPYHPSPHFSSHPPPYSTSLPSHLTTSSYLRPVPSYPSSPRYFTRSNSAPDVYGRPEITQLPIQFRERKDIQVIESSSDEEVSEKVLNSLHHYYPSFIGSFLVKWPTQDVKEISISMETHTIINHENIFINTLHRLNNVHCEL